MLFNGTEGNHTPFRPLTGSFTPMEPDPETRRRVEAIVRDYPDWGPAQIDTELKCDGHDVPFAMVCTALAEMQVGR